MRQEPRAVRKLHEEALMHGSCFSQSLTPTASCTNHDSLGHSISEAGVLICSSFSTVSHALQMLAMPGLRAVIG